uniref:C2H2-type domain-containing protein n=1 Tax=Xiphophorus couchianus TaxID=32473 RepID=A0A3B5KQ32_9TELE
MATGTENRHDHILEKAKLSPTSGKRRRAEGKPKKNFPCQECQKAFNSLEKLRVHSYSHTGERPYRCSHPDCTKAFVSKYKLLRHMATHSPEKSHKCSYCEKMFHRKDHLKNHLHTHDPHKEAFTCQECGKSYNTKLGFKRHLALHAAHSGDLTCQVCLQLFPSTVVLLEHLKTHAGKPSGGTKEKKHCCEHCERQFYTRKDVRRHMVVHTGRKDFLCQFCAQRFGRKDHLTRHMKKSHTRELLRVKSEPADSLETDPFSSPSNPFSLKYPLKLETYLMELQNTFEEACLSKISTPAAGPAADSMASSSSLMDFSQLFNFLPHNGIGPAVTFPSTEESVPLLQLPPQIPVGEEPAESPLQGLPSSFICSLSTPTTLPRFHQAFQ